MISPSKLNIGHLVGFKSKGGLREMGIVVSIDVWNSNKSATILRRRGLLGKVEDVVIEKFEDLEPISLNAYWLTRMHFVKSVMYSGIDKETWWEIRHNNFFMIKEMSATSFALYFNGQYKIIDYLHELQSLYADFVNEELPFK